MAGRSSITQSLNDLCCVVHTPAILDGMVRLNFHQRALEGGFADTL